MKLAGDMISLVLRKRISSAKRTWHFTGKNIHDFVWAADPDYDHLVRKQMALC